MRSPIILIVLLAGCASAMNRATTTISPEELTRLARENDVEVIRAVARNTHTPDPVLSELAGHKDIDVRRSVARNPATNVSTLVKLDGATATHAIVAESAVYQRLRMIVDLPRSSPEQLAEAATFPSLQPAVATHPNATESLLLSLPLAKSEVRAALAGNPLTPPEMLVTFSLDSSSVVRGAVALNPSLPPRVLVVLAVDPDSVVQQAAMRHEQLPSIDQVGKEIREPNIERTPDSLALLATVPRYQRLVALNPNTSEATLIALVRALPLDAYSRLGDDIIRHPKTPPEALRILASHQYRLIREQVARHPATPADVLGRLAKDDDRDVRESVAQNGTTPPNVLERLAEDQSATVRALVGQHAYLPPSVLARLAEDSSDEVLQVVARHPNTPVDSLRRLATFVKSRDWYQRETNSTATRNLQLQDLHRRYPQFLIDVRVRMHQKGYSLSGMPNQPGPRGGPGWREEVTVRLYLRDSRAFSARVHLRIDGTDDSEMVFLGRTWPAVVAAHTREFFLYADWGSVRDWVVQFLDRVEAILSH